MQQRAKNNDWQGDGGGGGLFPYARQDSLHNHGHVVAFSWVFGTPLSHMSGPLESAAWA